MHISLRSFGHHGERIPPIVVKTYGGRYHGKDEKRVDVNTRIAKKRARVTHICITEKEHRSKMKGRVKRTQCRCSS